MKKLLCLIFAVSLLFLFAACSVEVSEPKEPTDVSIGNEGSVDSLEQELNEALEEALGEIEFSDEEPSVNVAEANIEETVIYEKEGLKVTAKEIDYDDLFGIGINMHIENSSDTNLTVQLRNVSVNGFMVDPMFSCDVAAGKKANDSITFMSSEFETAGITTIKDVEFILNIFETDTWDEVADSDVIMLVTDAVDYVQSVDDSGSVAYEDDGIKIVVKSLDSEDSFWGSDLYLYIENNSDENITVQARDCSVNGFMVEPYFSSDVLVGKKAFDAITFMETELEENDITDIENIELSFHIFNMDTWDDITDTDVITITF